VTFSFSSLFHIPHHLWVRGAYVVVPGSECQIDSGSTLRGEHSKRSLRSWLDRRAVHNAARRSPPEGAIHGWSSGMPTFSTAEHEM